MNFYNYLREFTGEIKRIPFPNPGPAPHCPYPQPVHHELEDVQGSSFPENKE